MKPNPIDPSLVNLDSCGCGSGVTSQTPESVSNRPGLPAIRFRSGTHSQFKASLLASLTSSKRKALASLRTRESDDPAIALLDGFATIADVLTFYSERIANENFLRTATERSSVLELARMIGYELKPGVAASTWMAFTVDDAPGTPGFASIPEGTKIQTIPGPDEKPQVYETVEAIENARASWNALKPLSKRVVIPEFGDREIWLKGTATKLQPGDAILMVGTEREEDSGSERWDFRFVETVHADTASCTTRVTWSEMLGWRRAAGGALVYPAREGFKFFALRQRAAIFGHNAPEWKTLPMSVRAAYLEVDEKTKVDPKEWPAFVLSAPAVPLKTENVPAANVDRATIVGRQITKPRADEIDLDTRYPQIAKGSWLVLHRIGAVELFTVTAVAEDARSEYMISGKTTRVTLAGENLEWFPRANDKRWKPLLKDGLTKEDIVKLTELTTHTAASRTDLEKLVGTILNGDTHLAAVMRLAGENLFNEHVRDTSVFAQSEMLEIAETPFATPLMGSDIELSARLDPLPPDGRRLIFSGRASRVKLLSGAGKLELVESSGKAHPTFIDEILTVVEAPPRLPLEGETADWILRNANGITGTVAAEAKHFRFLSSLAGDPVVTEFVLLKHAAPDPASGRTRFVLEDPLQHAFDAATVTIHANVANATHGETVAEVLGSGDASRAHQQFSLKQAPLTHVPAANATGSESTLRLFVDDVKWAECNSLFGRDPRDRAYASRRQPDGSTRITFGDGKSGSLLPTGHENLRAVYRKGIGLEGLARAEQISLLMTRPLGVKSVTNPGASSGAEDPEQLEDARRNAPLQTLTLGRIVSLQDYEDFARSFAGIAKAHAVRAWATHERGVLVTITAPKGIKLPADHATVGNLRDAIVSLGDPLVPVRIVPGDITAFVIAGRVVCFADRIPEKVKAAVDEALRTAFSFESRGFGQGVALSEVVSIIERVPGVDHVALTRLGYASRRANGDPVNPMLAAKTPLPGTKLKEAKPAELLVLSEESLSQLEVTGPEK